METDPMDTLAIACDLTPLPDHERGAHVALAEHLFTHGVQERRALPGGLAFRFAANECLSAMSSAVARSLPLRSTCNCSRRMSGSSSLESPR
jgi:hypothetical protein